MSLLGGPLQVFGMKLSLSCYDLEAQLTDGKLFRSPNCIGSDHSSESCRSSAQTASLQPGLSSLRPNTIEAVTGRVENSNLSQGYALSAGAIMII